MSFRFSWRQINYLEGKWRLQQCCGIGLVVEVILNQGIYVHKQHCFPGNLEEIRFN